MPQHRLIFRYNESRLYKVLNVKMFSIVTDLHNLHVGQQPLVRQQEINNHIELCAPGSQANGLCKLRVCPCLSVFAWLYVCVCVYVCYTVCLLLFSTSILFLPNTNLFNKPFRRPTALILPWQSRSCKLTANSKPGTIMNEQSLTNSHYCKDKLQCL